MIFYNCTGYLREAEKGGWKIEGSARPFRIRSLKRLEIDYLLKFIGRCQSMFVTFFFYLGLKSNLLQIVRQTGYIKCEFVLITVRILCYFLIRVLETIMVAVLSQSFSIYRVNKILSPISIGGTKIKSSDKHKSRNA